MQILKVARTAALALAVAVGGWTVSEQVNAAGHGGAKDIVDTAAGNDSFTTLVAAVQAGGLVDTLKGEGPFTVFAPTNDAFAKLPAGTVDNLLKPENKDQLVAILAYHVVPGKVPSSAIAGKKVQPKTVQGAMLDIDATDGVTVNGAKVIEADIMTSNGVIHVIDGVLIPPKN